MPDPCPVCGYPDGHGGLCCPSTLRSKRPPRNPRAEFDAYEEGYADAIADVLAFLRSIGRTEECTYEQARIAADFSERIKDGDANGARHG